MTRAAAKSWPDVPGRQALKGCGHESSSIEDPCREAHGPSELIGGMDGMGPVQVAQSCFTLTRLLPIQMAMGLASLMKSPA